MLVNPQGCSESFTVVRSRHRSSLPPMVRNLIEQRIERLPSNELVELRADLISFILERVNEFESDVQVLHAEIMAEAERLVVERVIVPVAHELDQTLRDTVEEAESVFADMKPSTGSNVHFRVGVGHSVESPQQWRAMKQDLQKVGEQIDGEYGECELYSPVERNKCENSPVRIHRVQRQRNQKEVQQDGVQPDDDPVSQGVRRLAPKCIEIRKHTFKDVQRDEQ